MQEQELPDVDKEYLLTYWATPAVTMIVYSVLWLAIALGAIVISSIANLGLVEYLQQFGLLAVLLVTTAVIPPILTGATMQRRHGLRPETPIAIALGPLVGSGPLIAEAGMLLYLAGIAVLGALGALLAAGVERVREYLAPGE